MYIVEYIYMCIYTYLKSGATELLTVGRDREEREKKKRAFPSILSLPR